MQVHHLAELVRVGDHRGSLPFRKVEHHQHGLAAEEAKTGQQFIFFGGNGHVPQRFFGGEFLLEALEQGHIAVDGGLFTPAALLAFFVQALQLALDGDQVVEDKFAVHGGQVTPWIDGFLDVGNIFILEAAHDVDKAIHLGKLVEQSARNAGLTGAAIQAGDIGVGHLGINRLLGFEHGRKPVDPRIRHVDYGGVDFNFTGGGAGRLGATGERVEQGSFSGLGEADEFQVAWFQTP